MRVYCALVLGITNLCAEPPIGRGRAQQLRADVALLLDNHGDRLTRDGKERLAIAATLSRGGKASGAVRLLLEAPDKVRIEESGAVFGSDGDDRWKGGGTAAKDELDLIETLLYDSMDRFLIGQSEGLPTRLLGTRFRADGRTGGNYVGVLYDVFDVEEQVRDRGAKRRLSKRFFVNSDSQRLERVEYAVDAPSGRLHVAVQLANWRRIDGNDIPGSVVRYENGVETHKLEIGAATISAKAADGLFRNPGKP